MNDAVVERVPRWRRPLRWTVALVAVGLLTGEPFLLAATAVPLAAVAYGAVAGLPTDVDLRAERSIGEMDARPGEPVTVTLTVENAGTAPLTDCRVVDGVPDGLTVVEGSPRGSLSLRPGESVTVEYAVVARRGTAAFDPPAVRLRPLAATVVASGAVPIDGDERLRCANAASAAPRSEAALPRAGTVATDRGGSGVEFHATREYQPGDPVGRVDWRRFAKTGELATVAYREEQAVRTVLVVDGRPVARATPAPGFPTGAELSAYAAERLFAVLDDGGVVAGVAAVGLADEDVDGGLDDDGLLWIEPDADGSASARAATAFAGVQSAAARDRAAVAADGGDDAGGEGDATPSPERVCTRLPSAARVVLVTPLLDEWPVALVERLAALGYPTTVVSPDVAGTAGGAGAATANAETGASTANAGAGAAIPMAGTDDGAGVELGAGLAAARRRLRLRAVEQSGATAVDWTPTDSVDAALRSSLASLGG